MKREKGITLIALVITIIVLIILAGVTLSVVMDNEGIIGKAISAKDQTKKSAVEEIIRLEVLENKMEDNGSGLEKEKLKEKIAQKLKDQGYKVEEDNNTVIYNNQNTIKIEDYLGENKENIKKEYKVGEKVIVEGENFYVIKDSGESEENLILLAEKNVNKRTLKQTNSTEASVFSSTNYWSSIAGITYPYNINEIETNVSTDVINIAKAYGTAKGGIGRLITLEEVVALGGNTDANSTSECPSWINTSNYWLGSAGYSDGMWNIRNTNGSSGTLGGNSYRESAPCGIRPVIEISKSNPKIGKDREYEYDEGDKVTVGGESFYVIKACNKTDETVTLLAEKNIDITTLKQTDSTGTVAFSSTNYWSSIVGITYPYNINEIETNVSTDVINIAKAYGTAKGGIGRLITLEEVVALGGNTDANSTSECPSWINTSNYWLGSAGYSDGMWNIRDTNGSKGVLGGNSYSDHWRCGVRPVIEVSKSKIEKN